MKTNGNSKPRRQFPAETKLQILKEGRTTNLTIIQLLQPNLFDDSFSFGALFMKQLA